MRSSINPDRFTCYRRMVSEFFLLKVAFSSPSLLNRINLIRLSDFWDERWNHFVKWQRNFSVWWRSEKGKIAWRLAPRSLLSQPAIPLTWEGTRFITIHFSLPDFFTMSLWFALRNISTVGGSNIQIRWDAFTLSTTSNESRKVGRKSESLENLFPLTLFIHFRAHLNEDDFSFCHRTTSLKRSTPFKASSESWIGSGNGLVMENPRFLRLLSKTTTKTRHDKRRKSFSIFRRFSSTYASSNIDKTSIQKKKSSHAVSMSSGESEKKTTSQVGKTFCFFLSSLFIARMWFHI